MSRRVPVQLSEGPGSNPQQEASGMRRRLWSVVCCVSLHLTVHLMPNSFWTVANNFKEGVKIFSPVSWTKIHPHFSGANSLSLVFTNLNWDKILTTCQTCEHSKTSKILLFFSRTFFETMLCIMLCYRKELTLGQKSYMPLHGILLEC